MLRLLLAALLAASCLALPASAEPQPQPQAAPAARVRTAHLRMTWEQRFAAANTTHDGHLTLEQAKAGYITVARHFTAIDATGKGFITEDDIRAWHKSQRSQRRPAAENKLRPRHAFQPSLSRHPAVKASIGGSATVGPEPAPRPVAAPAPG